MAPNQWLLELEQSTRNGYVELLAKSGSLAVAAYHVAVARCQVCSISSNVPTRLELGVAASLIVDRAGLPARVPPSCVLASDCEAEGLPVL